MVLSDRLRQVSALQGVNGNESKTVRTYPRGHLGPYVHSIPDSFSCRPVNLSGIV